MPDIPSSKAKVAKAVKTVSLRIPTPPTPTARKSKGKQQRAIDVRHNHGEWESNAKELEMYWRHMRFETDESIAREFDDSHIIHEALCAWGTVNMLSLVSELVYDADGNVASEKVPTGSPGDCYLKTAIMDLNEIRKLSAADKPSIKDRVIVTPD